MFTGLVQSIGTVTKLHHFKLEVTAAVKSPALGESISINGACLTVTSKKKTGSKWNLSFDLSPETLKKTNLSSFKVGSPVNVERCVTLQTLLGGHLVQGHVDGVGRVEAIRAFGSNKEIFFRAPDAIARYIVVKGSIAVNGVSLTAAQVKGSVFSVALIPHTLHHTNLGNLKGGDPVNLEADVVAKYVEKLIKHR